MFIKLSLTLHVYYNYYILEININISDDFYFLNLIIYENIFQ